MKKSLIIIWLISLIFFGFTSGAGAQVAVGYELLGFLPHALTLTYANEASGWGLKASGDFGTSTLSSLATVFVSMFSLGSNTTNISFYTLSLTKDLSQEKNFRNYLKVGAFFVAAKVGSENIIRTAPSLGFGMEWKNLWKSPLAGTMEIAYPEILTVGMKYYF